MKTLFLLLILWTTFSFSALAQTEKGNFLAGVHVGNFIISRKSTIGSSIQIRPTSGYFITKGLAIGLVIPYYHYFTKIGGNSIKLTQFGVSPFLRYYVGNGIVKPVVGASVGYMRTSARDNFTKQESLNSILYSMGGGAALFLNEHISFELTAQYTGATNKDFNTYDSYHNTSVGLGFANTITMNLGCILFF